MPGRKKQIEKLTLTYDRSRGVKSIYQSNGTKKGKKSRQRRERRAEMKTRFFSDLEHNMADGEEGAIRRSRLHQLRPVS